MISNESKKALRAEIEILKDRREVLNQKLVTINSEREAVLKEKQELINSIQKIQDDLNG